MLSRSSPSVGGNSPTAFGAEWGQAWVAAGFTPRARHSDLVDGSVSAGIGIGDSRRSVGVSVAVTSFSTVRSGFGSIMAFDIKVHRRLGRTWAIALGFDNVLRNHGIDTPAGAYVVATKWIRLNRPSEPFSTIVFSLGAGTGRFRSEDQMLRDDDGPNVFGSAAVRISQPLAFIADWTGQDLALLFSAIPVARWPLGIKLGVVNITGSAGDGARIAVSAGWGFNF
jgi:hypothetical protein